MTECANCGQQAPGRYCGNCGQYGNPAPDNPARGRAARVLAALWLGASQAVLIGGFLVVVVAAVVLSGGVTPFSSTANDPTFGFLSGITLRTSLPLLGLVVGGGTVLGTVVGSWRLWRRRRYGWAVLVSSLPLLLLLVVVGSVVMWDSL